MKKPVSFRALEQRINRKLKKEGMTMRRNRGGPYMEQYGPFYVVDLKNNSIVDGVDDLEAYGRQLGVLAEWEKLAAD